MIRSSEGRLLLSHTCSRLYSHRSCSSYAKFYLKKVCLIHIMVNPLCAGDWGLHFHIELMFCFLIFTDTALMKSLMSKAAGGQEERKERKLPAVTMPASRPMEWISSWPGPH